MRPHLSFYVHFSFLRIDLLHFQARCHKRRLNLALVCLFCVEVHFFCWNKFRQLVPLLTNKDMSLIMRGRLYSSCVRSSMLHGSETWPVRKENVVALQRAEMRMVQWMCGVKLKDRLPNKKLRETRYR